MAANTSIKVTLCGKKVEIPLQSPRASDAWFELVEETLKEMGLSTDILLKGQSVGEKTEEAGVTFFDILTTLAFKSPKKMRELLFAYAPSLDQEDILDNSNVPEIYEAFVEVCVKNGFFHAFEGLKLVKSGNLTMTNGSQKK